MCLFARCQISMRKQNNTVNFLKFVDLDSYIFAGKATSLCLTRNEAKIVSGHG